MNPLLDKPSDDTDPEPENDYPSIDLTAEQVTAAGLDDKNDGDTVEITGTVKSNDDGSKSIQIVSFEPDDDDGETDPTEDENGAGARPDGLKPPRVLGPKAAGFGKM